VALIITDVSEEHISFIIKVDGNSELTFSTLMIEVISSSEKSVLPGATWPHITEDDILRGDGHENLKCDIALIDWALPRRSNISCEVPTVFLYPRRRHSS
jgi:hypothetical protein